MLSRALLITCLALTAGHASFTDFAKSLQYGFTYH